MLPIVAIVGRPNVGKSTLFNVLTRSHAAIVADVPGVTRDRQYGYSRVGARAVRTDRYRRPDRASQGSGRADAYADREGGGGGRSHDPGGRCACRPDAQDQFIARELRRTGKPVVLALNKAEGLERDLVAADFHALGLGMPLAIAASHGQGCLELIDTLLAGWSPSRAAGRGQRAIRVAVIGRPNVGKSTLVNRLIGEERVIASEQPGTTRDSILVPFQRDGREFLFIDTAGVRRRARVEDAVERASVARTLQAIAEAHVVILVLDAHDSVGEQDASVLGQALDRGRVILIAVNKWDGIARSSARRFAASSR